MTRQNDRLSSLQSMLLLSVRKGRWDLYKSAIRCLPPPQVYALNTIMAEASRTSAHQLRQATWMGWHAMKKHCLVVAAVGKPGVIDIE